MHMVMDCGRFLEPIRAEMMLHHDKLRGNYVIMFVIDHEDYNHNNLL